MEILNSLLQGFATAISPVNLLWALVGCVLGTGIGGIATIETQHDVLRDRGAGSVSPLSIPLMMGNAGAAALSLLADDVVILESGGAETRDEYRAHHLPGDIAYARAVPSERGPLRATVKGDAAWVTGTSTSRGEFRGRAVNSTGAELVVLARDGGAWKIRAIHWSSRSRRPAGTDGAK